MAENQTALWNGTSGHAWVDAQRVLDQMFKPLEERLTAIVSARSRAHVLDVGCGTGATTLAAARALGANGTATGIDISQPMIDAARARAERERVPATFVCADAQRHTFQPASVDLIVSRFGVMFFDDPAGAFANLRRAAADRADLRCIAWRGPVDNPFMTTAERAAAPLLPNLPERQPGAAGQFAFADDRRVRGILAESGWREIAIEPLDVECMLAEDDLVPYLGRFGPVGRILQEVDAETCSRVLVAVRAAFDPYVHAGVVRFTAACWMIGARA